MNAWQRSKNMCTHKTIRFHELKKSTLHCYAVLFIFNEPMDQVQEKGTRLCQVTFLGGTQVTCFQTQSPVLCAPCIYKSARRTGLFLLNCLDSELDFCSKILDSKQDFRAKKMGSKYDFVQTFWSTSKHFGSNNLSLKQEFCLSILD